MADDYLPSGAPRHQRALRPPVLVRFRPAGVPVPTTVPRLEYLAIRALGEVPRLLLEASNTPYDMVHHFGDKSKWKSRADFTQLPIYSDGVLGEGVWLAQSGAIVRHIARSAGLDGDTPARKALADVAYEASKDINGKKAGVYPAAPEADKAALAGFLGGAEHLLARGGGPFTGGAGAGLTFGDLGLFHALKTIDEIQPGFLARAGFPLLARFTDTVAALPHVAAYLASDRRLPLTANETDAAPWRPDGYAWLTPLPASLLAHEA